MRGVLELFLWSLLYGVEKLASPLVAVDRLRRRTAPAPAPGSRPIDEETHAAGEPAAVRIEAEAQANPEEEEKMNVDQDLSGDMVKVVQFTIVSVATDIRDNARVLLWPARIVAFSDDMTAADFTSWILSRRRYKRDMLIQAWDRFRDELPECAEDDETPFLALSREKERDLFKEHKHEFYRSEGYGLLKSPKYHRVAFHVISRFAEADFNWDQVQAKYLKKIADRLPCPPGAENDA